MSKAYTAKNRTVQSQDRSKMMTTTTRKTAIAAEEIVDVAAEEASLNEWKEVKKGERRQT